MNLQSNLNHLEKGNLITIKLQNSMLFCLIHSAKIFHFQTNQ
ncbi:unnamed protein product [Paramecium sonneborni]|uniref:Uncharacterized protein n=1 Tax=Paramecium sonneborni TaxID=65129 RepID=A0A8S1RE00_9CILI|nr:unnamed protein product [Paramecium sonneborni]